MVKIPEFVKKRPWTNHYPDEVSPEINIPEKSFVDFAEEKMKEFKERTAMFYKDKEYTYADLRNRAYKFGAGLKNLGVEKGSTVAIYMTNSPDWAAAYHGSMMAGCKVTGISPLFSSRELKYQLNDSETDVIALDEGFYPVLMEIFDDIDLNEVIVTGEDGVEIEGDFQTMSKLLSGKSKRPDVNINTDEIAVLQYTGGTTGLPKGCMLTHKNLLSNVLQNSQWYDYVTKKLGVDNLTAISLLPWYHILGQTCEVNTALVAGASAVVVPDFDAEKTMELIEEHQCQMFLGVPTMFKMISSHPKFEEYDLSCLKWVVSGAAPLPQEVYDKFKEVQDVVICNGYGLSEACPVTHLTPPLEEPERRNGILSVGVAYPNTLTGIIDLNKNEPEFLPAGEEGEIVVSGPQVMKGYWQRPEKSEEVFFEAEGRKWLKTGDIAVMDEEGFTYPVDREKDMITYKGHSVFPREIEEVYFKHPDVDDVAVIGVDDEFAGENIKAFIVPDGEADEEELKEYGKDNLAAYKFPREIELIEEIPKTDAGKYLKRKLREREKSE